MHQATMTALEFTRIQQTLAAHAACQLGKELALAIQPLPSRTLTERTQQETTEARAILRTGRSLPFGGIRDVRRPVEQAMRAGVLRPEQLAEVADTISGCRQLHRFLQDHQAAAPLLARHAQAFGRFDGLEAEIRRCIDRGEVSSRASRGLRETRNEIATLEKQVQERLQGMLRQLRDHLQEALITSRNGRYVLPVKASARSRVPGSVHGSSASGSTLFVEPEAVRQVSDELEAWRAMEVAETERVLAELSDLVAAQGEGLLATLEATAQLDLIFARGRLSQAWEAEPVVWNEEGAVDLRNARHPLLGRAAKGNRIRMSAESRMLIVTGPNTGGKTLLLKTLGLLVLTARCGLHIPVAEGSTLCWFDQVYADIGDNQSLEQSLSTFSGHIANVAPMLQTAGPATLILLDELGSGTDPHEGTALGIAMLEGFLKTGAYTLVTTHLREIKEFGRLTPGCQIAGMGFDGETLRPTYQLIYGTLGESQGIAIAARAGLPPAVVRRALELVGREGEEPWTTAASQVVEKDVAATVVPVTATPRPAAMLEPWVVQPDSPRRCRVWMECAQRDLPIIDRLRVQLREGLLVGDHVRVQRGHVVDIAPRQGVLVRRDADTGAETAIAANLSQLLILLSARQPDFHPTMVARHLFYAEYCGVTPVIGLTKGDLVTDQEAYRLLQPFRAVGYPAVVVSAAKGRGLTELQARLADQLTGVMGYPGAGKTSLMQRLVGDRWQEADSPFSLRALSLPDKAWVVDLPGLRRLGMWKPELTAGFRDFAAAGGCARPGCLHRDEPECAVRAAVERGQIGEGRYRQYRALLDALGIRG